MLDLIPYDGIVEVRGSTPLFSTIIFNELNHIRYIAKMVTGALLAHSPVPIRACNATKCNVWSWNDNMADAETGFRTSRIRGDGCEFASPT